LPTFGDTHPSPLLSGRVPYRLQVEHLGRLVARRQNDVGKLSVFGSVACGEADARSDVDLLVEFSRPKSLLSVVALERQLSGAIGRKVDLLTETAIGPYLRD